eukprot:10747305-Lingulodinium_polyedra.AAC.1
MSWALSARGGGMSSHGLSGKWPRLLHAMRAFHAIGSATAMRAMHDFHASGKWPALVRGSESKLATAGSTGNQHWQQQQQEQ